jgi:hypothetical protein
MPKKLDYRAVWMDARALLAVHKEAIAAIVAICQSIAGEGGVPIVESAVKALFVAIEAVAFIVMLVAVNRQLSAQTPNQ